MKNNKVYQFRNLYSILVGLSSIAYCNYIFYFMAGSNYSTILFMVILVAYTPIYYGLLLLIFKYDMSRTEEDFGFVKGEIIMIIGFSISIVCAIFYTVSKYIFPHLWY